MFVCKILWGKATLTLICGQRNGLGYKRGEGLDVLVCFVFFSEFNRVAVLALSRFVLYSQRAH